MTHESTIWQMRNTKAGRAWRSDGNCACTHVANRQSQWQCQLHHVHQQLLHHLLETPLGTVKTAARYQTAQFYGQGRTRAADRIARQLLTGT